jgi:prepilin-type N-terminal cleavage/methylation domain-containing protein
MKLRPGYTLMEMLLVVALIVIAAAVSIPLMQTMLTDARITAAADSVRGQLAEAQARAMDEGRPWKFGVTANGSYYQLAPEDSSEWGNVTQEEVLKSDVIRGQLPREMVFALKTEDLFPKETSDPGPTDGQWTIVAVYLPTGGTRDDGKIFFGKPGIVPMCLQVRSLTGAVTVEQGKAE